MKKLLMALAFTFAFLCIFAVVSFADNITLPQCAVPPTIDGKVSKDEYYGAFHRFMNNEKGNYVYSDKPNPSAKDKAEQCKGFDIYMFWYNDPTESGELYDVKKGGLYICVVAQDKTYGTVFKDGEAANASDCFQLCINPTSKKVSGSSKSFVFDFAPETTKKGVSLIYEHFQYQCKPLTAFEYKIKAIRNKNGYTMEIFIPWMMLNINNKIPPHRVGGKFSMGFICMDWVGASPYYDIADFGKGKPISQIASSSNYYNDVTYGDTVYPPGYKANGDLTKIKELIKKAETYVKDKDSYIKSSYSAFELALKEAKGMTSTMEQKKIDAAYKKLDTAIKGLKKAADATAYDELKAAIDSAALFVETDYHPETWERFAKALEAAKKLNDKSKDEDLKKATEELTIAINGLVPKDQELEEVDYSGLVARTSTIEAMNESDYTAESWAALKELYDKAKDIVSKKESNQFEVNSLIQEIDAAKEALAPAGSEQTTAPAESSSSEEPKDADKVSPVPFIIIGAAVVVAAVVVVIILLNKKKKAK